MRAARGSIAIAGDRGGRSGSALRLRRRLSLSLFGSISPHGCSWRCGGCVSDATPLSKVGVVNSARCREAYPGPGDEAHTGFCRGVLRRPDGGHNTRAGLPCAVAGLSRLVGPDISEYADSAKRAAAYRCYPFSRRPEGRGRLAQQHALPDRRSPSAQPRTRRFGAPRPGEVVYAPSSPGGPTE